MRNMKNQTLIQSMRQTAEQLTQIADTLESLSTNLTAGPAKGSPSIAPRRTRTGWSLERRNRLRRLVRARRPVAAIATILGVKPEAVERHMAQTFSKSTLARYRRSMKPAVVESLKTKAAKAAAKVKSYRRKKWTTADHAKLAKFVAAGVARTEIAKRLKRSATSVYSEITKQNLAGPRGGA